MPRVVAKLPPPRDDKDVKGVPTHKAFMAINTMSVRLWKLLNEIVLSQFVPRSLERGENGELTPEHDMYYLEPMYEYV